MGDVTLIFGGLISVGDTYDGSAVPKPLGIYCSFSATGA
jgi:hypothetical protein